MAKLIDILARELKVWPEDMEVIGQAKNGWLHISKSDIRHDGYIEQKFTMAEDWEFAQVTQIQWRAAVDTLKAESPSLHIQQIGRVTRIPSWSGDGMPPVGTICELKSASKFTEGTRLDEFPAGTRMLVGGHANFGGSDVVAVIVHGRNFCGTIIPEMLLPVRTPEQIKKEERSKACDAMYGIMTSPPVRDGNRSDMAEALYDAGYRLFEITDDSDPA